MGTKNTKMDPSSANFYDAVRQNRLIRFEHLLDPMEIQSFGGGGIKIKSFFYLILNDSQKPNATYAIRQQQQK